MTAETNSPETSNKPQYTEVDRLKQVTEVNRLWQLALDFDKTEDGPFVVFSKENPFAKEHNDAMILLQEIAQVVFSSAKS